MEELYLLLNTRFLQSIIDIFVNEVCTDFGEINLYQKQKSTNVSFSKTKYDTNKGIYKYLYRTQLFILKENMKDLLIYMVNCNVKMLAYKAERPYIINAELSGKAEMLIRTEGVVINN